MYVGFQSKQFALQLPVNCRLQFKLICLQISQISAFISKNGSKHYFLIEESLFLVRATSSIMEGKSVPLLGNIKNMPSCP